MGEGHESSTLEIVTINDNPFNLTLTTIMLFLLLTSISRIVFHYFQIKSLPECGLIIILGVLFGGILKAFGIGDETVLTFEEDVFFLILIPPIILEAGYHIHANFFFNNIAMILLYAVLGTVLNAVAFGVCVWAVLGVTNTEMSLVECLVFGALMSSVDPVAVLAIFEEVRVNETLNILAFGESVLNDAVSIVLYHVFLAMTNLENGFSPSLPFLAVVKFLVVGIGGWLAGMLFGVLAALATKYTEHVHLLEPLLVFVFALLSYTVVEIFHFSGIVSIMFCGVVMSRYVEANIDKKSHVTINFGMKIIASTAETLVFVSLGVNLVYEMARRDAYDLVLMALSVAFILPIRFIFIYLLTWIANFNRLAKISFEDQFILSYGGLRGAVSFALAFSLSEKIPARQRIITTTLAIIIFTVFVQGMTIKPLIKFLRVRLQSKKEKKKEMSGKILSRAFVHISEACHLITESKHSGWFGIFHIWRSLDKWIYRVAVRHMYEEEEDLLHAIQAAQKYQGNKVNQEELNEANKTVQKLSNNGRINLKRIHQYAASPRTHNNPSPFRRTNQPTVLEEWEKAVSSDGDAPRESRLTLAPMASRPNLFASDTFLSSLKDRIHSTPLRSSTPPPRSILKTRSEDQKRPKMRPATRLKTDDYTFFKDKEHKDKDLKKTEENLALEVQGEEEPQSTEDEAIQVQDSSEFDTHTEDSDSDSGSNSSNHHSNIVSQLGQLEDD